MRVLHFSADDLTGGAAKAASRLHSAFRRAGHQSQMVVKRKKSDDDTVSQAPPPLPRPWRSRFERLRRRLPGLRRIELTANYTFNFDLKPQIDTKSLLDGSIQQPDIICLHWISGLLNTKLIRDLFDHYRCPIVWIMADQEPMTGGCHYSFGCDGYQHECGRCPQLDSTDHHDHSHLTWQHKKKYLSEIPICFIAPTSWGANRIKESSLFRNHQVELIPYPIDTTTFRPIDRQIARDLLHLPFDKKIVFFGATYLDDRRKGMKQLVESIMKLAELIDRGCEIERQDVFLCVAGLNGKDLISKLPFAAAYIGHLNDDLTLALAYQAADLFLCPSIEDAGPMMIPEAMLCATPVVAFNTGGAPDLIETMKTGYLAMHADATDLAQGVYTLLTRDSLSAMRAAAREAASHAHTPSVVVEKHLDLYARLKSKQSLPNPGMGQRVLQSAYRASGGESSLR